LFLSIGKNINHRKISLKNKQYNIVKNIIYSGISTATTFFLFILLAFVGRLLGKEEYGVFTTALSIATIFEMFTDFGLRDLSVRNVSRDKSLTEPYIGNLLIWKILIWFPIFAVMMIIINFMGYDGQTKLVIYILTFSAFLKNIKYTFRIFFQAHDMFGWDTVLVFIERTALLVLGLAALFYWKSLLPFAICFTAIRLFDFLITMAVLRWKIAPIKLRFNFQMMKRLQLEALPLGLFFVILTIFSYIDTVMLSVMRDFSEVGLYNAAFKIYEGITIIPTIFWLVILPRLSELYTTDPGYHKRLAIKSVKYMFVTGLPTLTYGILFSHFLITFFFKGEYTPAVGTLQILFFGIAFQYPNWMLNSILISMNRQRVIMFLGLGGLGFKVLLNLLFIPLWGYNGSAVATVIAEFVIFAGEAFYLYRHSIKLPVLRLAIKPIIASVLIYVAFKYLGAIPLVPLVLLTGIIYLVVIFVLKTFDREEVGVIVDGIQSMVKR
jgi:O-antigen/teichoic acid export membrane protein